MSANIPPKPYFSGINFNPSFFSVIQTYLTEVIANTKYLLLSGSNYMTGNLGIKRTAAVELDVNGKAYINNFIYGVPAVGDYGGTSAKLILKAGSASETPMAFGVNSSDLWFGTYTLGNHVFYTGINERLRIASTTITVANNMTLKLPVGILDLSDVTTNSPLYLAPTGSSLLAVANGNTQYSVSALTGDTVLRAQTTKKLLLQAGTGNAALTVYESGNVAVGLGGGTSTSKFHINSSSANVEVKLQITDGTTGAGATNGCAIIKTSSQDMFITNYQATRMVFAVNGSTNAITISALGAVCIGLTNPTQALQVADGGRLRISNGVGDYTSIGARNAFDDNNTRIEISDIARTGATGAIVYKSTSATGYHQFLVNGATENIRITQDDFQISTSCSTYGFNYYTDGEYIPQTQKINTSGTVVTGYFHICSYFFSSLVNVIVSHTSISYTYWAGHFITNNNTQPISINVLNSSNMSFSAFQEQTTLIWYFVCVPTVAYNASDQLRVKFYG